MTVVRYLGDNWNLEPRIVAKGELKQFHWTSLMKSSTSLFRSAFQSAAKMPNIISNV